MSICHPHPNPGGLVLDHKLLQTIARHSTSSSLLQQKIPISPTQVIPFSDSSPSHKTWRENFQPKFRFSSSRIVGALSFPIPMETSSKSVMKLKAIDATPDSFQEFGQVIEASPDGEEFGPSDAQLDLSRGIPRFYIMHLEDRQLKFRSITHHASVTQCLGSIGGHEWYLGVAKASILDVNKFDDDKGRKVVQSRCGHYYVPPVPDEVHVFRIVGPKFLKLHTGTWHAGPLFKAKTMDFYNLELSNTNVVDHTTHNFNKEDGVVFVVDD